MVFSVLGCVWIIQVVYVWHLSTFLLSASLFLSLFSLCLKGLATITKLHYFFFQAREVVPGNRCGKQKVLNGQGREACDVWVSAGAGGHKVWMWPRSRGMGRRQNKSEEQRASGCQTVNVEVEEFRSRMWACGDGAKMRSSGVVSLNNKCCYFTLQKSQKG